MKNVYVKQKENSAYLDDYSFEAKDGYVQVYPTTKQLIKLMDFTEQCFLRPENGTLKVPDDNGVPADADNLKWQEWQETINQLKADRTDLQTRLTKTEKDAKNKQKVIDGQQMLINFFSKKLNDLGANVQELKEDAKKQQEPNEAQNNQKADGGKQ